MELSEAQENYPIVVWGRAVIQGPFLDEMIRVFRVNFSKQGTISGTLGVFSTTCNTNPKIKLF